MRSEGIVLLLSALLLPQITLARYDSERVLLGEVSAITLHNNQRTTGRRSSPVPQLKCVGGSAGCKAFVPKVVQCINRGSDGYDIQWECKTDMDDSYRFGNIQVTCEGYDYPDDPYILRGSCGLEYTIDYTEAGKARKQNGYNSDGYWHSDSIYDKSSGCSWTILIVIVILIFLLVRCLSPGNSDESSSRSSDPTGRNRRQPPPYGFKPEYTSGASDEPPPTYDDTIRGNTNSRCGTNTNASPIGGFWSGLGLGGLGGYLFGRRNNYYRHSYSHTNYRRPYGGWGNQGGYFGGGNGWGSSGSSWSWGNSGSRWGTSSNRSSSSSRSTSRTTSGFGGTSRR